MALLSSAIVVLVSSALITSFFASAMPRTTTPALDAGAAKGKPFIVALGRTPGGPSEWRTYLSALARVGEAIERPVRVRYVESRSALTRLLLTGQVDAAFVCTYCYLQVADKPGVSLVAAPVIAGRTMDAAVLVVRADCGCRSLSDLRGRRIGVADPTSLAGTAYLLWLADQHGMDATSSLVLVRRDSQEENIRALLRGEVEATVVNRSQLASWPGAGLRVLATSPEFGMPPFVTGPTVDGATRDLVQRALLTMRPSSETTPTSIEGFAAPKSGDYDFARVLEKCTCQPTGAR